MTCVTSPLAVVGSCGTCPTCCSVTVGKRTPERIPVCIEWSHRLDCAAPWALKSVKHTVKLNTGESLTHPQYDPSSAYSNGETVSFGGKWYTASGSVSAGTAPLPASESWVEGGTNDDLYVALDNDNDFQEWVDKRAVSTTVLLGGGVNDTDYRVEAVATFRDCEGHTIELWDCARVKVLDCE